MQRKGYLSEYLEERKKSKYTTEFMFVSTSSDRGLSAHGLKHWTERIKKLTGMRFHVHQFRHSFACKLARNNVSSYNLQKLMGHTDLRMTERYLRSLSVDDLRDDIERLSVDAWQ